MSNEICTTTIVPCKVKLFVYAALIRNYRDEHYVLLYSTKKKAIEGLFREMCENMFLHTCKGNWRRPPDEIMQYIDESAEGYCIKSEHKNNFAILEDITQLYDSMGFDDYHWELFKKEVE